MPPVRFTPQWISLKTMENSIVQVSDHGEFWQRLCSSGLNRYSPVNELFTRIAAENNAFVRGTEVIIFGNDCNKAVARLEVVLARIYTAYVKVAAKKEKRHGAVRKYLECLDRWN